MATVALAPTSIVSMECWSLPAAYAMEATDVDGRSANSASPKTIRSVSSSRHSFTSDSVNPKDFNSPVMSARCVAGLTASLTHPQMPISHTDVGFWSKLSTLSSFIQAVSSFSVMVLGRISDPGGGVLWMGLPDFSRWPVGHSTT